MSCFRIARAGAKPLWVAAAILLPAVLVAATVGTGLTGPPLLMLGLVTALLAISLRGAFAARFEISPQGLRLRGDFYGRRFLANQLRVTEASRVDFAASPELKPKLRAFGTGLPGYQSGWFRLWNNERALLYLTDRSRAVRVPTTKGYSLLLSPEDPDAFLAALRSLVGTIK